MAAEELLLCTLDRIFHLPSDSQWPYYEHIRRAVVTGIEQLGLTENFKDYANRVTGIVNSTEAVSPMGDRVRLRVEVGEMWSAHEVELDNFTFDLLRSPGYVSMKSVFCLSTESRPPIYIHAFFYVGAVNI
jgi:hypothetical protein